MKLSAELVESRDGWAVRIDVDRRNPASIRVVDDRVCWNDDDLGIGEGSSNSCFVLAISNFVGHDHDSTLSTLGRYQDGALSNIDRAGGGLNHDERYINSLIWEARERPDARLKVGDNDRVFRRYGAEQLLGG